MGIANGPEAIDEVNVHEGERNGEARTVDTRQFLQLIRMFSLSFFSLFVVFHSPNLVVHIISIQK